MFTLVCTLLAVSLTLNVVWCPLTGATLLWLAQWGLVSWASLGFLSMIATFAYSKDTRDKVVKNILLCLLSGPLGLGVTVYQILTK